MIFRFFLGIALVALALWVIVGEQITGASADATINARVVTLRAPIAGDLVFPARELGTIVTRGEALATVSDPLVDGVRGDDLELEVALATAEVARFTGLRDETAKIIEALQDRSDVFRDRRIAEINLRLDYARARLALLEDGVFPPAFDIAPPDDAGVERAEVADVEGLQALWTNAVQERIGVLENELAAAQNGVFLGDGYNDAPNAQQRITELESELAGYTIRLTEAEARLAAYQARLRDERVRINTARFVQLSSTVQGRLWQILQANGTNIQRGDAVARLLDCNSVLVTASVTQSVYNTLDVGDGAVFRTTDDSRNLDATVIRLAGPGAETIYQNLAIAPSERHLQRFDVALAVPDLASESDLSCAIGRTGRVFFDGRPLDLFRRLGLDG